MIFLLGFQSKTFAVGNQNISFHIRVNTSWAFFNFFLNFYEETQALWAYLDLLFGHGGDRPLVNAGVDHEGHKVLVKALSKLGPDL